MKKLNIIPTTTHDVFALVASVASVASVAGLYYHTLKPTLYSQTATAAMLCINVENGMTIVSFRARCVLVLRR